MPNHDPKHPRNTRAYNGSFLTAQTHSQGLKLNPDERDAFLNAMAKQGRVTNAKETPPPPPPPPVDVTLLYPFLLSIFPTWRYGLQGRGDCMAWSAMHSVDILMAVNIALLEKHEYSRALGSIEAQYGFMRVEVLGGSPDYGGDGGSPSAAAESLIVCGTLHRMTYLDDQYDLTNYDETGGRSGDWGRYGVPDPLEPIARKHPVKTVALVTDFDTAVKVIASGLPISNAHQRNPIPTHRDKQGFADKKWFGSHAMNYIGYRLGDRPGLLQSNTGHGNHVSGPMQPDDCPPQIANCSAWIDADEADDVLSAQWSWVYSGYTGFPKRNLSKSPVSADQVHPSL